MLHVLSQRHGSLRTTFRAYSGEPVQVVLPELPVDLTEFEASSDAELQARIECFVATPFNLASGPLIRVLYSRRTGSGEASLSWVVHHLVCDGLSLAYLAREFLILLQDGPQALPRVPSLTFTDHAAIQARQHNPESRAYWRSLLADCPVRLPLPSVNAAREANTANAAGYATDIPTILAEKVQALGSTVGATEFTVLLVSFFALMSKISRERNITVGIPVAGRNQSHSRRIVGFFANTTLMSVNVLPSDNFAHLLNSVGKQLVLLLRHQDYPFASMLADAGITPTQGEFPVTPVLFNMLPQTKNITPLLPRKQGHFALPTDAKVDWAWYLHRRNDGICFEIHYKTALFLPETIKAVADAFMVLLKSAVARPESAIADLPLLADDSLRSMVYDWNNTVAPYSRDTLAHELFEQQVARAGCACAVVDGITRLSYDDLNAQANRLAHFLRQVGVRPEEKVAVCIERSADLIVAVLAILKAGGAYVPIDHSTPAERLGAILKDCAPMAVLTRSDSMANLPALDVPKLCMDIDSVEWERMPFTNPLRLAGPANLAYIVYTSGTSGRPKGVMKEHEGLSNYLAFLRRTCALEPSDVVLQITNVAFDPFARDIFGPLSVGAKLVMPRSQDATNPRALLRLIRDSQVSLLLSITPSMLAEICASSESATANGLRCILTSGEALTESDVGAARRVFGAHLRVVNQYGPSEITMIATYCEAPAEGPVTIGRPVDNVAVYILDEGFNPVPVGIPGELHLSGVGLARGYLGKPELTREKFVPNPFGAAGSHMFRTGDLGRYRHDATIEYLGRIDDQVKVGGVRIEIGEVEAALRQIDSVQAAAVVVHEDAQGGKKLVAYLVSREMGRLPGHLRKVLGAKLPSNFIPSKFILVDALPLTPNGKLNRRALPALPQGGTRPMDMAFRSPTSPTEKQLTQIWTDVLRIDSVGADDDFFELGGNSLQAMRILARTSKEFGVDVPLRELYRASTLAQLARAIDQAKVRSSELDGVSAPGGTSIRIDF